METFENPHVGAANHVLDCGHGKYPIISKEGGQVLISSSPSWLGLLMPSFCRQSCTCFLAKLGQNRVTLAAWADEIWVSLAVWFLGGLKAAPATQPCVALSGLAGLAETPNWLSTSIILSSLQFHSRGWRPPCSSLLGPESLISPCQFREPRSSCSCS